MSTKLDPYKIGKQLSLAQDSDLIGCQIRTVHWIGCWVPPRAEGVICQPPRQEDRWVQVQFQKPAGRWWAPTSALEDWYVIEVKPEPKRSVEWPQNVQICKLCNRIMVSGIGGWDIRCPVHGISPATTVKVILGPNTPE